MSSILSESVSALSGGLLGEADKFGDCNPVEPKTQ